VTRVPRDARRTALREMPKGSKQDACHGFREMRAEPRFERVARSKTCRRSVTRSERCAPDRASRGSSSFVACDLVPRDARRDRASSVLEYDRCSERCAPDRASRATTDACLDWFTAGSERCAPDRASRGVVHHLGMGGFKKFREMCAGPRFERSIRVMPGNSDVCGPDCERRSRRDRRRSRMPDTCTPSRACRLPSCESRPTCRDVHTASTPAR
jgi:hypothetical protein